MPDRPPSAPLRRILVTGISGNLGRRLVPLLKKFEIISVDLYPPPREISAGQFFHLDLSTPAGRKELSHIVENEAIDAVVHLAFVIDPVRTRIVDENRMWQANVAATQELLQAIARRNRDSTRVQLFIFPSSVSAYGSPLDRVKEEAPLEGHTLPYAVHKREADVICQKLFPELGGCAMYIYRPHIYAGATVDNFILRSIRGRPSGRGWLAKAFEKFGWKVPALLPKSSAGGLLQFIHVDDMARVLLWTLENYEQAQLRIFNLAGSGDPITFGECVRLAGTPVLRVRSAKQIQRLLKIFWVLGLSGVSPQTIPYFLYPYTMDTTRIELELGSARKEILRYSTREAIEEALRS